MAAETNSRLEAKLGFDRIRKIISDRCSTEYAALRAMEEEISTRPEVIRERLSLTEEMRLVMMFEDAFPTAGYIDCIAFLEPLADEGARIDLLSMGKLRTLLDTMQKIRRFFSGMKEGVYPCLHKMAGSLFVFPEISGRIDQLLDKAGQMKDTASDRLYEIRKGIREKETAISRRINALLKKAKEEGIAEENAAPVMRDGRLLLPVVSSHKRKILGFVYDESASGKTTFVEPAEVVELENELSELHFSENREISVILSAFSDFVRPDVPALLIGARQVCEMDFLMAKALTALDFIAGLPLISENGELNLRKARHPLLERTLKKEGRQMVPLSVTLTPQKRILLISGPNAGGKSVCLKTVGLLQYMFQWGMLIPTSETSEMRVFDRIMAEIGDGQSIDNDLSTYGSFLNAMKRMLREADGNTLVLIDEFGSGTEPAAGGAIAESILSELDRRGVYGVITTHYTNLKLYAASQDCGVANGAMEFDSGMMAPLFKLEIGLPGNSFAFEMARKIGLPEPIVKDAENRAGEEYVGLERNLRKIARNRRVMEEKLQKIKRTDRTLEDITGKYQKELEGIRKLKAEILGEAKKEAEEIVKQANRQVERTIKEIRESQAGRAQTMQARKELQSFVDALGSRKAQEARAREDYIEQKLRQLGERGGKAGSLRMKNAGGQEGGNPEAEAAEAFRKGPLKVGEKVRIKDNGMVGEVCRVSNKSVSVIVGDITGKLPLDRVERVSSNEYRAALRKTAAPAAASVGDGSISERKLNFQTEIDVRGMRAEEAIDTVLRWVDDAIMLAVPSVRIVHGKGTGALRIEIQQFLRTVPGIRSVRDEQVQFGGTGVTVVTFE